MKRGSLPVRHKFATTAAGIGLGAAGFSLLKLVELSGLAAEATLSTLGVWIVAFLLGIFLFGWGLGKRTGP